MMELTDEKIAEWLEWEKRSERMWKDPTRNLPHVLPRWLDPNSNDWVELLEALPITVHVSFIFHPVGTECILQDHHYEDKHIDIGSGRGIGRREAFLAALAQLIDDGGE